MARAALAVVLAALALVPPHASAHHEMAIVLDWTAGRFNAGLLVVGVGAVDDGDPVPESGIGPLNLQRFALALDACHRRVVFDLDYAPERARVEIDDLAVQLVYEFQAELFDAAGNQIGSFRVSHPGSTFTLGTVPGAGTYRLDLYMLTGVQVDWTLRVRAFEADTGCA